MKDIKKIALVASVGVIIYLLLKTDCNDRKTA